MQNATDAELGNAAGDAAAADRSEGGRARGPHAAYATPHPRLRATHRQCDGREPGRWGHWLALRQQRHLTGQNPFHA